MVAFAVGNGELNMRFVSRALRFAKDRLRAFANRRRVSHTLTLEGLVFVVLLACIGFAAINTGANLLYLVFAMMAALMVVSALASWLTLRGLTVERRAPKTAVAGEEACVALRVRNAKRFLHSYSLRIIDQEDRGRAAGICYLMRLGSRQTAALEYQGVFERRGLRRLKWLRVSTRFPFGFVEKAVSRPAPHEILVFPRMGPAAAFLERHSVDLGREESGRKGHGISLYALRPYTRDDSARMIHWKVSAKSSELILREMESDERQKFSLLLDNYVEPGRRADLDQDFECAVSCVASVARELIERGFQVEVLTRSGRVPFDDGANHLTRILRALALIELRERNGQKPPLPRPESDSQGLWFDYGAGLSGEAAMASSLRILDVAAWQRPASASREAV